MRKAPQTKLNIMMQANNGYAVSVGGFKLATNLVAGIHATCTLNGHPLNLSTDDRTRLVGNQLKSRDVIIPATEAGVKNEFDKLCRMAARSGSALIPVDISEEGASGGQVSVRVEGVYLTNPEKDGASMSATYVVNVARKWISEIGGRQFIPKYILNRAIHETVLDGKSWPHDIVGGVWLHADSVWRDLYEPLISKIDFVNAAVESHLSIQRNAVSTAGVLDQGSDSVKFISPPVEAYVPIALERWQQLESVHVRAV